MATRPMPTPNHSPDCSPSLIGFSRPGRHWAGDGGHVPTRVRRNGKETIWSIAYTIANPAMKYRPTATGRDWLRYLALTPNTMAAIQNGMVAPLTRLEMPANTRGETPPTNASTLATQNAHDCLCSCTEG